MAALSELEDDLASEGDEDLNEVTCKLLCLGRSHLFGYASFKICHFNTRYISSV
jgi:hypothetical protein